jgi:hypothetical protein
MRTAMSMPDRDVRNSAGIFGIFLFSETDDMSIVIL